MNAWASLPPRCLRTVSKAAQVAGAGAPRCTFSAHYRVNSKREQRCISKQSLPSATSAAAVGAQQIAQLAAVPAFASLREVHVWWAFPDRISDVKLLAAYEALVSEADRQYVAAAADAAVQRERLVARALTRAVLARYLGGALSPHDLAFEKNANGKPHLSPATLAAAAAAAAAAGAAPFASSLVAAAAPLVALTVAAPPGLQFNVTHTPTAVGLAVSLSSAVGLDVEEARRQPRNPMALARRRFSAEEVADLEALSADAEAQRRRFVQLWTLKEAFVKCKGLGISAPPGLAGFSIRLLPASAASNGSVGLYSASAAPCGIANGANGSAGAQLGAGSGGATAGGAAQPHPGNGSCTGSAGGESSSAGGSALQAELRSAITEPHAYRFALLSPSSDHLAALCVQLPAGTGAAPGDGQRGGAEGGWQPGEDGEGAAPTVRMFECVPLVSEAALGTTALL